MLVVFNRTCTLPQYDLLSRKAKDGVAILSTIVRARRAAPQDDGISRMLDGEPAGRPLGDDEVACLCFVLFLLGVETTTSLLGSAIRTLLERPQAYQELRREPALVKPAVEELLRFESPVQVSVRQATAARSLGGHAVRPGERVLLLLGAANRDPAVFPDPDRLDFRRSGPPHLAFGEGRHHCVGATLTRLEAQIGLAAFLAKPPCRRSDGDVSFWPYQIVRRLRSLPLEIEA
jgi:cytochrome P450